MSRDTLQEQGFRFVLRAGRFEWVASQWRQPGDVDCTDMDDDEFAAFVAATEQREQT